MKYVAESQNPTELKIEVSPSKEKGYNTISKPVEIGPGSKSPSNTSPAIWAGRHHCGVQAQDKMVKKDEWRKKSVWEEEKKQTDKDRQKDRPKAYNETDLKTEYKYVTFCCN